MIAAVPRSSAEAKRADGLRRAGSLSGTCSMTVHRFEETIGGRPYLIEVMPVSDRWRAQLQRGPGVAMAMMPFYGQTPDEAARRLTHWLTLAHQRQALSTVETS